MRTIDVLHLEVTPWEVTDAAMRGQQHERIRGEREDLLIFVEHPEVVTVGPRARNEGQAPPSDYATASTDRGGGLTWHGPGQLVVYPIVHWDLDGEANVAAVIHRLEGWVIAALAELGIEAHRDERMQGVWVEGRKVCSIGLSFLRWVNRHGLTVNLDTPPGRVEALAGCGLQPDMTTSLRALGHDVKRTAMVDAMLRTAAQSLNRAPNL